MNDLDTVALTRVGKSGVAPCKATLGIDGVAEPFFAVPFLKHETVRHDYVREQW